jgi:streptogramin lyase
MARRLAIVVLVWIAGATWAAGAHASMVTEFAGGFTPGFTPNMAPFDLTTGSDGDLWFTEHGNPGAIAYIDQSGVVHEFTQGLTPNNGPWGVAAGAAGTGCRLQLTCKVWFTEFGTTTPRIASVDHSGVVHEFVPGVTSGFSANASPFAMTLGPDGHVWWTDLAGRIAYIDENGAVHEIAAGLTQGLPLGITAGPGRRIWFTEGEGRGAIGYIDGGGVVHEFIGGLTSGFPAHRDPQQIATGPDGHIWFIELGAPSGVAYLDDDGVVHEFTAGHTPGFSAGAQAAGLVAGPDGNLWFTEVGLPGRLARLNFTNGVPNGTVTEFTAGSVSGLSPDAEPSRITNGPDGHLWFIDGGGPGRLGRINGPDVASGAGTADSPDSASLTGTVNPNGTSIADCHFEFGTNPAYGTSIPCAQTVGGGTAPVAVSTMLGALSPGQSYHFRIVAANAFGTGAGDDETFTMPPASAAAGATIGIDQTLTTGTGMGGGVAGSSSALAPPQVLAASVRPSLFAVQRGRASQGGRARKPASRQPPIGTTFRFTLSEAARVAFTIQPILPGREVGRGCVAKTRRNRANHACTRLGEPGGLAVNAVAGQNSTKFSGRIGGHLLTPGRYLVTLVASDAAGRRSAPVRLRFQVVPGGGAR